MLYSYLILLHRSMYIFFNHNYFIFFIIITISFKCYAMFEEVEKDHFYQYRWDPHLVFCIKRVTEKNKGRWESFAEQVEKHIQLKNIALRSKYTAAEAKSLREKFIQDPSKYPEMLFIYRYQQTLPIFKACLKGSALQNENVNPPNSIWIAYAAQIEQGNILKKNKTSYIEIAMTVTTNEDTPLVKCMGIFRNPLCKVKNQHLSALLHGFAAQAILEIHEGKKFMFTFPRANMTKILITALHEKNILGDDYRDIEITEKGRGEYSVSGKKAEWVINFFKFYQLPWKIGYGRIFIIPLNTLSELFLFTSELSGGQLKVSHNEEISGPVKTFRKKHHTFSVIPPPPTNLPDEQSMSRWFFKSYFPIIAWEKPTSLFMSLIVTLWNWLKVKHLSSSDMELLESII